MSITVNPYQQVGKTGNASGRNAIGPPLPIAGAESAQRHESVHDFTLAIAGLTHLSFADVACSANPALVCFSANTLLRWGIDIAEAIDAADAGVTSVYGQVFPRRYRRSDRVLSATTAVGQAIVADL